MPGNSAAAPSVGGAEEIRGGLGRTETRPRAEGTRGTVSTELVGQWPTHAQREQVGSGRAEQPAPPVHDEALEFVRFCYRRRRVGWPELYDEMCAVAARGAFRGLGYAELADHGISFCLGNLSRLAELTDRVTREERGLNEGRTTNAPMILAAQPATG
jgi:hypothetical protein